MGPGSYIGAGSVDVVVLDSGAPNGIADGNVDGSSGFCQGTQPGSNMETSSRITHVEFRSCRDVRRYKNIGAQKLLAGSRTPGTAL